MEFNMVNVSRRQADEAERRLPELLGRVSPPGRFVLSNLRKNKKKRCRFIFSYVEYLIAEKFSLDELQINYLESCYDIQSVITRKAQKNWFHEWYASVMDPLRYYNREVWRAWGKNISFLGFSGVGKVHFCPTTTPQMIQS